MRIYGCAAAQSPGNNSLMNKNVETRFENAFHFISGVLRKLPLLEGQRWGGSRRPFCHEHSNPHPARGLRGLGLFTTRSALSQSLSGHHSAPRSFDKVWKGSGGSR